MEQRGDQTVETETEASAGSKEGVVRWVLLIALVLAIGFLTIIWVTGALSQGDVEEEATVGGIIQSQGEDRGEPITPAFETQPAPANDADETADGAAADATSQAQ